VTAAAPNAFELLARERKAVAIADSLIRLVEVQLSDHEALHALAALAHGFTPEQRRIHARAAHVREASDATWERVEQILCQRARVAEGGNS
jgi:hypothetical protein